MDVASHRPRRRGATAGLERVEPLGQPAATTGGGVLVDRPLHRDLVQAGRHLIQLGLGLFGVAAAEGSRECLHLGLEQFLARPVAGVSPDVLADALLGGNRMSHGRCSPNVGRSKFKAAPAQSSRRGAKGQKFNDTRENVQRASRA